MPLLRLILMILVMGLLVAVLQFAIWRVSRGTAFFKYIPSIVLLIVTVACIVKAIWFSTGMEDLAYFVTAMLTGGVFLVSIIAGLLFDLISKVRRYKDS